MRTAEFLNDSSKATAGILFFGVPAKDGEYCINWRNNIVAIITRETVMKTI